MLSFNADLVDDIARRRAVLFLGAGVSSSAKTQSGARFKGWDEFLSFAAERTQADVMLQIADLLNSKDYLLACELLRTAIADDWDSLVQTEYGQSAEPSDLHKAIVDLDPRIIVTTNFDKLIESSWIVKLGSAERFPTTLSSIGDEAFRALRDHDNRYLLKIHGTVDSPDELVFAKSQYQQKAFSSWQYATLLEALLLNYTVVFIGFSMNDPAINFIIEGYAHKFPKCRPHYAFLPGPIPSNIRDISRKLRKLHIIEYDPANNHEALPRQLASLKDEVEKRRKELIATAVTS